MVLVRIRSFGLKKRGISQVKEIEIFKPLKLKITKEIKINIKLLNLFLCIFENTDHYKTKKCPDHPSAGSYML